MKKYLILIFLFAGIVVMVISCKKDQSYRAKFKTTSGDALVKIMNVSPNFLATTGYSDNFNVWIANLKVNGPLLPYATTLAGGYPSTVATFPIATANTNTYAAVRTGDQHIRLSLQGKTLIDSTTIIDVPFYLGPNTKYSIFITDSFKLTPAKFIFQDNFLTPDSGKYAVRFAHMVVNDTAGKKVDVYSVKQATILFSNVSPGTVTDFMSLPLKSGDTISILRSGTSLELTRYPPLTPSPITSGPSAITYSNSKRVYTIIYKGDGKLTTGAKQRSVIVLNNQ